MISLSQSILTKCLCISLTTKRFYILQVYFQFHFLSELCFLSASAQKYFFFFENILFKSKMIKSLVLLEMHWRHLAMAIKCRWNWILMFLDDQIYNSVSWLFSCPGLETLCKMALYLLLIPKMTDTGFHCLVSGSCVLWLAALPFLKLWFIGAEQALALYVLKWN